MNGLTANEWVRATIIADVFHWGIVGVLALIGLLVQRWLRRRQRHTVPCPVPKCQLGRGHVMPCWDGTPDPKREERL